MSAVICAPFFATKKAKTAPSAPKVTMIIVPIPLLFFGINSLTKVIAAPNSPASPIPASNRQNLYASTVVTKALATFATL